MPPECFLVQPEMRGEWRLTPFISLNSLRENSQSEEAMPGGDFAGKDHAAARAGDWGTDRNPVGRAKVIVVLGLVDQALKGWPAKSQISSGRLDG